LKPTNKSVTGKKINQLDVKRYVRM